MSQQRRPLAFGGIPVVSVLNEIYCSEVTSSNRLILVTPVHFNDRIMGLVRRK